MFLPVALDRDGLPLSTYPMYSSARPDEVTLVTAYGIGSDGRRGTLTLDAIGRSDDPLVVAGELRAAVRAGRADGACREIAARVQRDRRFSAVAEIEVVGERYDVVTQVVDDAGPIERDIHATCVVGEVSSR